MIEFPVDPGRRLVDAARPYLAPVVGEAGWLGFFLLLAPVIGPRGYGLFTLAISGIAIAEALLVEPAARALRRIAAPEDRHWSTMLVTMIALGTATSFALYAAAGPVAAAVGEEGFGDIFRSLAVLPLLGALTVVPRAALRREGRAAVVSAAGVAGVVAGGGIGVALAWAGEGPWSLVAQIVVQRLVECTVLWGVPGERIGIIWSPRHFADLARQADWRALAGVCPAIVAHGRFILIGVVLGPTATGLYLLATRLGQALVAMFLVPDEGDSLPARAVRRACRVLLPCALASTLLVIALPPLVDLRWWGAVLPAQIALLSALPAAIAFIGTACAGGGRAPTRWQAMQAFGELVVTGLAAASGLAAVAAANVAWLAIVAVAGLAPVRRGFGGGLAAARAPALRAVAGAGTAGGLLFVAVGPVSLALAPVTALCLLTAAAWLVYLLIRGEPEDGVPPAMAPTVLPAPAIDRR
jgi:PST family polysaccharide transporter